MVHQCKIEPAIPVDRKDIWPMNALKAVIGTNNNKIITIREVFYKNILIS